MVISTYNEVICFYLAGIVLYVHSVLLYCVKYRLKLIFKTSLFNV